MRIIAFPYRESAYTRAFYATIEEDGIEVLEGDWSARWLRQNVGKDDVVHVHWPSFMYKSAGPYGSVIRAFCRCIVLLLLTKWQTRHFWWTAHNLMPHERCVIPYLDVIARHLVVFLATRIFVHGAEAEAVLVARFPAAKGKCTRIPHGNWIDHYQPSLTREAARMLLDLPAHGFIYLCFGQCKPYKNVDGLIKAFLRMASADDLLLIAGMFPDKSYHAAVVNLANGDPRIRIDARFIPEQEVSRYICASDVMCVPYREILTSGTAMLALTFGKPVISIDRGFLRDVLSQDTGILVNAGNEQALVDALRDIRNRLWSTEDIIRHARQFRFTDAAAAVLNVLD